VRNCLLLCTCVCERQSAYKCERAFVYVSEGCFGYCVYVAGCVCARLCLGLQIVAAPLIRFM